MDNTEQLLDFIDKSKTTYQAAKTTAEILANNGFEELDEKAAWKLKKGRKYFIRKGDSAVAAFVTGKGELENEGFRLIGAHTDSPGFRIKPNAEMKVENTYIKINTEGYGGAILSTWFDRPLSFAGRVTLRTSDPFKPEVRLVDLRRPVAVIPNLAIHMNREINDGHKYNKQKDTLPLLGLGGGNIKEDVIYQLIADELDIDKDEILDYDLYLYETAKGTVMGINNEFISAGRLDDLWMAFAGIKAILGSPEINPCKVLFLSGNEEIGSFTMQGADSALLDTVLERIAIGLGKTREEFKRAVASSIMLSADLAHAVHPNYQEKADPTNRPVLGGGPVLKIAAGGSYSTDSYSGAVFKAVCRNAEVPYQEFTNRSDLRGGTTIGPISASKLNIPVIDMGAPILGMHSVRELAAVKDNEYVIKAFKQFFS